ncbi:glycosyl transferase family 90 [Novipirellula artificiosorum]|uniref:Glycosyl transferase CAP10 domain-containing protein n=1 Tax=Novipirellula artificiosorum TaxID=2528016 RepID=A0A5C6E222_9BACT|nr:glycosyl transferase family 90 [Novipirellula artificiosorum]TWU42534.1 hypothetical protein Poly41_08310 [Novipirellula artificiosorum]
MGIENHLPQQVVLPYDRIFEDGRFVGYWKYVRGTLEGMNGVIKLEYSKHLVRRGWSAFEIRVDDEVVVIDYSDFLLVDTASAAFKHWLRFHHTPAFVPYPNLGSFPPWSFLDWADYTRAKALPSYTASGESIVYRHSDLNNRLPNLVQRRTRAMELLQKHCDDPMTIGKLQTGFIAQQMYFRDCLDSLVVVHIPGSHPHILDRTVQQMFALGVCVISPDLWTTCLEHRPQAGIHYVGIQDDYSDLSVKIQWVAEHRDEAVAIGRSAKQFFAKYCTPTAIWSYIHKRVSEPRALPSESSRDATTT